MDLEQLLSQAPGPHGTPGSRGPQWTPGARSRGGRSLAGKAQSLPDAARRKRPWVSNRFPNAVPWVTNIIQYNPILIQYI
jgi:hypothetical protein